MTLVLPKKNRQKHGLDIMCTFEDVPLQFIIFPQKFLKL
jgi:hypothetical protein